MGYGMGSGFELYVQDRAGGDIATLQEHANKFIAGLNQRPEISMAYTSFDTKFPQYMVEVDAVKCQRANVSASDVLSVLSGFIGGNYSSISTVSPNFTASWYRQRRITGWTRMH